MMMVLVIMMVMVVVKVIAIAIIDYISNLFGLILIMNCELCIQVVLLVVELIVIGVVTMGILRVDEVVLMLIRWAMVLIPVILMLLLLHGLNHVVIRD